ncbi:MAG TPA: AAA family ATPase, partial [Myxococcaceae bacterium]|nr:AAA family ATPase [Myxococcaceae bacterium]
MDLSFKYQALGVIHESPEWLLYRARSLRPGPPLLLKVSRASTASPARERLQHEYELGRHLDSPTIARPLALGSWQGQPALVLEGGSGSLQVLLDAPVPLERFLHLAARLAAALAELHRHHVIHKDLKPDNLLVEPETDEVKLMGLGLATRLSDDEQRTPQDSGLLEGSLAYISPEQTGRTRRVLDGRTDLYSLGIVFYRMLTGTLPFHAEDAVEWVHCHLARVPPPLHERAPSVPQVVDHIVLKLLAKVPEERYQSAWGLRHDLERCLEQLQRTGHVSPFPLGEQDVSDRFLVPHRLYGREQELAALHAAFERVTARGLPELVLVSGAPGIGKTTLVEELRQPVLRERGLFLAGKFDQLQRNVPYATLVQAFRGVMHALLAESEEQVRA